MKSRKRRQGSCVEDIEKCNDRGREECLGLILQSMGGVSPEGIGGIHPTIDKDCPVDVTV